MNIGLIHGFVGGGGGTEKTLTAIIEALETTDHNVTLYTISKPKLKSKKIKIRNSLPISISSFGLYQRAMESKLISKAKNEDILIQASGGLGIPSTNDQKIIVYAHSDFSSELDNPSSKYKGIWSLYYKAYYSMIKKFIDNIGDSRIHIISNSQYVQNLIKTKFNKNSKIIYPPVNLSEFFPENKENSVVTVGRFSKEKNFDFGINVMSHSNFNYKIIGNTKTKSNILYYDKLESKIKNENLMKINLFKNLERSKLVGIINNARVYFHCSKETFGISTIEGIAAGCIPIVPDVGAHKETVPYDELRYTENDSNEAREKISEAMKGTFDELKSPLLDSIQKYDRQEFMKNMIRYIEDI